MSSPENTIEPAGVDPDSEKVAFHYIKSPSFRVVLADGAHGGVSPRGLIQASFYSTRNPIPRRTVQSVLPDGTLGDELTEERVVRDGPVRDVEVTVMMDLNTARSFHSWLGDKISTLEAALEGE